MRHFSSKEQLLKRKPLVTTTYQYNFIHNYYYFNVLRNDWSILTGYTLGWNNCRLLATTYILWLTTLLHKKGEVKLLMIKLGLTLLNTAQWTIQHSFHPPANQSSFGKFLDRELFSFLYLLRTSCVEGVLALSCKHGIS